MTREQIRAVQEMLGDQATALDAAYVLREMEERGISIAEASSMDDRDWLELVDRALDAGAREIRALLRRYDIGIAWHEIEDALKDRRLLDAITAWHRATDHAVAGTSETCLAYGWYELKQAIEMSSDPIAEISGQIEWWYRAYMALDTAQSKGQAHIIEEVYERLLDGDLEGAEEAAEQALEGE